MHESDLPEEPPEEPPEGFPPEDILQPDEADIESAIPSRQNEEPPAPFDPDDASFRGVQLIEASAGTGKTWNIAALVVRAIRQGIPGHPTITIDQILVVTFGEAATKELRDRIRTRLFDELQAEPDAAIRIRLEDAVRGFDEAAIYTIHSFCQRSLQDNAFESGVLFDFELVPDSRSLTLEAADDFWWMMMQREGVDVVDMLLDLGVTPDKLVSLADRVPRVNGDVKLVPDAHPGWAQQIRDHIQEYRQTSQAYFHDIIQTWKQEETAIRASRIPFPLQCDLADWIEGRRIFPSKRILEEIVDKKRQGFDLFQLIRNFDQIYLQELKDSIYELRVVLLREWLLFRDRELGRRKRRANALFFDDLLYQLDAALRGTGGRTLAKRIRAKYPLALIDEFQDTDLIQFSIFKRCYSGALAPAAPRPGERPDEETADLEEGEGSACLFLIGDPKQSIYSFRRADIYSYLNAQKEAGQTNTLLNNFRSEPGMVEGVNGLFTFRNNPFLERDIPFHRIKSKDKAGRFTVKGKTMAPLVFRIVDRTQVAANRSTGLISKTNFGEYVRRHTARRIARLLNLGQDGDAVITETDEETGEEKSRSVVPGDVAVLVRSHLQARQMQAELAELGVASVLQSQGKIFDTPEAEILLQVLSAIDAPFDQGRLRTALLTSLFGLRLADLAQMEADPGTFEKWLQKMQDYRNLWAESGFTTMFTRLLREQKVAARILETHRGERRMTNFQHLAELLGQTDNERRGGPGGLVQWLADQSGINREEDERELRLESDVRRVQIVTMHHAKGLEYRIVFVPYAWYIRQPNEDDPVGFFFHDPGNNYAPTWDLGSPEDMRKRHLRRRREENLAEEVRLLYVALTRAKHSCSVVWGPANVAEKSSLCYLLHGPNVPLGSYDDAHIEADLERLRDASEGTINFGSLRSSPVTHQPTIADKGELSHCESSRTPGLPYRISSFSALKGDRPHHDFHLPEHDDSQAAEAPAEPPSGFFAFPGGTQTGNLVHGVFENIDFTDPSGHAEAIQDQLVQHGFDNMDDAPAVIAELVRDVLATPLLEDGFTMADLPNTERLVEMEFFFPLHLVDPAALQTFCTVPIPQSRALGFMKGFIDLTFRHEGQFYILDYKSNHLGVTAADYAPEILAEEMAESGYDLQYLIYTVALHRYLKSRLLDYDYDTHMGGVLYVFVRAMPAAGVYRTRPDKAQVLALETILCGGGSDG